MLQNEISLLVSWVIFAWFGNAHHGCFLEHIACHCRMKLVYRTMTNRIIALLSFAHSSPM